MLVRVPEPGRDGLPDRVLLARDDEGDLDEHVQDLVQPRLEEAVDARLALAQQPHEEVGPARVGRVVGVDLAEVEPEPLEHEVDQVEGDFEGVDQEADVRGAQRAHVVVVGEVEDDDEELEEERVGQPQERVHEQRREHGVDGLELVVVELAEDDHEHLEEGGRQVRVAREVVAVDEVARDGVRQDDGQVDQHEAADFLVRQLGHEQQDGQLGVEREVDEGRDEHDHPVQDQQPVQQQLQPHQREEPREQLLRAQPLDSLALPKASNCAAATRWRKALNRSSSSTARMASEITQLKRCPRYSVL